MSDANKYAEIFDYLSAPDLPDSPEPAIVFGRNDPRVAHKLGDLAIPGLVEIAVISGGVGKDTGDLLARGYSSEADFLFQEAQSDAQTRDYELPHLIKDEKAANGVENAHNSLNLLKKYSNGLAAVTAIAHATSAKRLSESVKFESIRILDASPVVHTAPTDYNFDPYNDKDRQEAASELLRLAERPAMGFLGEQNDLPDYLVDFIKERHGNAPTPIKTWQTNLLRALPAGPRLKVIELAVRLGRK